MALKWVPIWLSNGSAVFENVLRIALRFPEQTKWKGRDSLIKDIWENLSREKVNRDIGEISDWVRSYV